MPIQRTPELLAALLDAGVEFVIIGGVAAVAHGSATFTVDFDVAAPFSRGNLDRLLQALGPFNPRYALAGDRRPITESAAELSRNKNLYILCDLGRLDVLAEVPPLGPYARVAESAVTVEVFQRPCKVISIDDLIAVKAHVGRGKDKQVELELRAIRARLANASH